MRFLDQPLSSFNGSRRYETLTRSVAVSRMPPSAPLAMGRYRRGNVGRINERETDAVRETDRGHRILNHLMMEYDHPGAARVTLQDRLECLQLRWIDDADRIGQRKVAAGIRIEENYTVSVIPRPGFDQRETLLPDLC